MEKIGMREILNAKGRPKEWETLWFLILYLFYFFLKMWYNKSIFIFCNSRFNNLNWRYPYE
jgi:hypothetical protein